jgi:TM2 domain-containing membrane protein YozV
MEKRQYRSGYHIDFISTKNNSARTNDPAVTSSFQSTDVNASGSSTSSAGVNEPDKQETKQTSDQKVPVSIKHAVITFANTALGTTDNTKQAPRATHKEKKAAKVSTAGSGKSQLVALLLCFFFGILGIHRFYLGYIGIGLIQLFTLGCAGIWTLIDLILIIVGSLKPKNGEYSKTF